MGWVQWGLRQRDLWTRDQGSSRRRYPCRRHNSEWCEVLVLLIYWILWPNKTLKNFVEKLMNFLSFFYIPHSVHRNICVFAISFPRFSQSVKGNLKSNDRVWALRSTCASFHENEHLFLTDRYFNTNHCSLSLRNEIFITIKNFFPFGHRPLSLSTRLALTRRCKAE